jgi:glycolate oxidase
VQISLDKFSTLLDFYRDASKTIATEGVNTLLFGHFGDCHLHCNFLATANALAAVDRQLEKLYKNCLNWQASPFAEHGVGVVKQPYIKQFYTPAQYAIFKQLKKKFDPANILFPQGYMSLES